MFYSIDLLKKRGGKFAVIWKAATLNKYNKSEVCHINIPKTCKDLIKHIIVENNSIRLSLTLSANLCYGVVRIYNKKAFYLLVEIKMFIESMRFKPFIEIKEKPKLIDSIPDPMIINEVPEFACQEHYSDIIITNEEWFKIPSLNENQYAANTVDNRSITLQEESISIQDQIPQIDIQDIGFITESEIRDLDMDYELSKTKKNKPTDLGSIQTGIKRKRTKNLAAPIAELENDTSFLAVDLTEKNVKKNKIDNEKPDVIPINFLDSGVVENIVLPEEVTIGGPIPSHDLAPPHKIYPETTPVVLTAKRLILSEVDQNVQHVNIKKKLIADKSSKIAAHIFKDGQENTANIVIEMDQRTIHNNLSIKADFLFHRNARDSSKKLNSFFSQFLKTTKIEDQATTTTSKELPSETMTSEVARDQSVQSSKTNSSLNLKITSLTKNTSLGLSFNNVSVPMIEPQMPNIDMEVEPQNQPIAPINEIQKPIVFDLAIADQLLSFNQALAKELDEAEMKGRILTFYDLCPRENTRYTAMTIFNHLLDAAKNKQCKLKQKINFGPIQILKFD